MLASTARFVPRFASAVRFVRAVSTLPTNPHIKVFPADASRASFLLSLLDSQPPNPRLAIGFATQDPPTPQTFTENQSFLNIMYEVLAEHAPQDEELLAQARAFAGPGGASLGAGGIFGAQQQHRRGNKKPSETTGAGGASGQGGAGGGGRGGYIHLSDSRNPPDFGRIAWPEDIIGSLELGATYVPDEDYEKLHAQDESEHGGSGDGSFVDEYGSGTQQSEGANTSTSSIDPLKKYKLPADPWHIKVRWETKTMSRRAYDHPDSYHVHEENMKRDFVALHVDIQIYEMEHGQGTCERVEDLLVLDAGSTAAPGQNGVLCKVAREDKCHGALSFRLIGI
ncbi:hypothetical protein BN1723_005036 [Verticillium longisporum]|uniref:Uncharacterized protein n=1 Tax=Verticillium longisporum TaxID=100787 RepID=A0A0G4N3P7_VERLO|nr:hypothetical protein BN1723_005036 [Verticillium longisporum]